MTWETRGPGRESVLVALGCHVLLHDLDLYLLELAVLTYRGDCRDQFVYVSSDPGGVPLLHEKGE